MKVITQYFMNENQQRCSYEFLVPINDYTTTDFM